MTDTPKTWKICRDKNGQSFIVPMRRGIPLLNDSSEDAAEETEATGDFEDTVPDQKQFLTETFGGPMFRVSEGRSF